MAMENACSRFLLVVLFHAKITIFGLNVKKSVCYQGHLGIYYYVETRSYGMFDLWAPTFPVLGCRSAEKVASWPPSTKPMAPPRRPQESRTTTMIRVIVRVQEVSSLVDKSLYLRTVPISSDWL